MTNHLQDNRRDVSREVNRSVRRGSLVAGVGVLVLAALAAVGQLVVIDGLVTEGNSAKTAEDILASEGMFRFGIATWYVVAVLAGSPPGPDSPTQPF